MVVLLKKVLRLLITLPAISDATSGHAFRVINGSYSESNNVITEKLKINGAAVLGEKTVIKETIIVNGSLKANGVTFESELISNGSATLENSWLKENAHI